MATFSALGWFQKHGANKTTSIDCGGLRTRLVGSPKELTDGGLIDLASRQEDSLRVALPRQKTEGGVIVKASGAFSPREVASLIREYAASDKEDAAPAPAAPANRVANILHPDGTFNGK